MNILAVGRSRACVAYYVYRTRYYRAWISRPVCQRERTDLKVLVHIREHFVLSNSICGRPRMTVELKEEGRDVGERRVGRLMKLNGIGSVRNRRHRITPDNRHSFGVAANILDGVFLANAPNRR